MTAEPWSRHFCGSVVVALQAIKSLDSAAHCDAKGKAIACRPAEVVPTSSGVSVGEGQVHRPCTKMASRCVVIGKDEFKPAKLQLVVTAAATGICHLLRIRH